MPGGVCGCDERVRADVAWWNCARERDGDAYATLTAVQATYGPHCGRAATAFVCPPSGGHLSAVDQLFLRGVQRTRSVARRPPVGELFDLGFQSEPDGDGAHFRHATGLVSSTAQLT